LRGSRSSRRNVRGKGGGIEIEKRGERRSKRRSPRVSAGGEIEKLQARGEIRRQSERGEKSESRLAEGLRERGEEVRCWRGRSGCGLCDRAGDGRKRPRLMQ